MGNFVTAASDQYAKTIKTLGILYKSLREQEKKLYTQLGVSDFSNFQKKFEDIKKNPAIRATINGSPENQQLLAELGISNYKRTYAGNTYAFQLKKEVKDNEDVEILRGDYLDAMIRDKIKNGQIKDGFVEIPDVEDTVLTLINISIIAPLLDEWFGIDNINKTVSDLTHEDLLQIELLAKSRLTGSIWKPVESKMKALEFNSNDVFRFAISNSKNPTERGITKAIDKVTIKLTDMDIDKAKNPNYEILVHFAYDLNRDSKSKLLRSYDFDIRNNIIENNSSSSENATDLKTAIWNKLISLAKDFEPLQKAFTKEMQSDYEKFDLNTSIASVQGFLGEIGTIAMIRAIYGNCVEATPTGNLKTKYLGVGNLVEIPIDTFLKLDNGGYAGIQVKNYTLSQDNEVITFSNEPNLPTFMNSHFRIDKEVQNVLIAFFGSWNRIMGMNAENTANEREAYMSEFKEFPYIANQYVMNALKIMNSFSIEGETDIIRQLNAAENSRYNTFFMINQTIVPSSSIVLAIIKVIAEQQKNTASLSINFEPGQAKTIRLLQKTKAEKKEKNTKDIYLRVTARDKDSYLTTSYSPRFDMLTPTEVYNEDTKNENMVKNIDMNYSIKLDFNKIIQQALGLIKLNGATPIK